MSVLLRLLRAIRGSTSRAWHSPGSNTARPVATADFQARMESLEATVQQRCAAGDLILAKDAVFSRLPRPTTQDQALSLMRRVVLPLIEQCAIRGKASIALHVEELAFTELVKRFEDPVHFEACLSLIDDAMHRLGVRDAQPIAPLGLEGARRLLFFVHNLEADLAHTQMLRELIEAYLSVQPEDAASIGIAGVCGADPSPLILSLQQRWPGLGVHVLRPSEGLRGPLIEMAKMVASATYDRIIVVSVPIAVSYLTGLLPPSRIGLLTMKYELACFEHLQHRCSFYSPGPRRVLSVNGRAWHQATGLMNRVSPLTPVGPSSTALRAARRHRHVFYTINREEKIRNRQFLARVARILKRVDDSIFVWTGRERLTEIDEFFAARGLENRHTFAGWVTPDDLLQTGDLFLDTPVLSGTVAARGAMLGLPVLMDADAINWIGLRLPTYLAETGTAGVAHLDKLIEPLRAQGIRLQTTGDDEYVEQAVRLVQEPQVRRQFGEALRVFAHHYFFDAGRSATDHFTNLRAPIVESGAPSAVPALNS